MELLKNKKLVWAYLLIFLTLLISIPLYNIKGFYYNCFSALDVGIYLEAILKLSRFEELNPFLLIRQYKIFNDHFDPIIFLGIPFVIIFPPFVGVVLLELSFLVASIILIIKKFKNELTQMSLAIFLLLTSRGILSAYMDPIHPSSWVIPIVFLMIHFAFTRKEWPLVLTFLSFLFFKESYVYSILGVSFCYLFNKKYKIFTSLFIISILHLIFVNVLREKWMGPVVPYSSRFLSGLIHSPLEHIIYLIKNLDYKSYAYFFLPYLPAFLFILKKEKFLKNFNSPIWLLICFSLPNLGIQILSNVIYKQHSVFLSSIIIGIIVYSSHLKDLLKNKLLVIITILSLLFSCSRHYTRIFKYLFSSNVRICEMSNERSESLKKARDVVKSIPEHQNVLASSGFIPYAQSRYRYFHHLGKYMNLNIKYDYLVLERGNKGYHLPYSAEEIEEFIQLCSEEQIYADKYVAIVKVDPYLWDTACLKKIKEVK